NGGTLATGSNSTGIFAGVNNTIVNAASGIIILGDDSVGIFAAGNSTITNAGQITIGNAGGPVAAIVAINDDNTVSNLAGATITVGNNADGIFLQGNRAIVNNAGTITVGAGFAVGIDVSSFGGSNSVINTGTINVGAGATGILLQGNGTIFNSGTINAAAGFAAIEFCGCGNSALTLGPGSVISGLVLGTGTETFQLGGTGKDTFNLSLI